MMSGYGYTDPPGQRGGGGEGGLARLALVLVLVLLVGVLGAGALAYRHLQGNITSASVKGLTGDDPTTSSRAAAGAENILLIGSDTRATAADVAAAGGYATAGARSDTTILLHLSADRSRAVAVSIPRDSWVPIPSCTTEQGKVLPAISGTKFNEAFSEGGAACTIKTVQQLTQVKVDHYVVMDFSGFKTMVDALGGVPVCLTKSANDPKSGLVLPAGRHVITGEQALAFVRARYTIGDGSDLGRIQRQQAFLAGLVQKATSTGTLVDLPKLYSFLDAATKSVTTDPGLASVRHLAALARSVKSVPESGISFVTVPTADRGDGANVVWTAQASTLWQLVRDDEPLSGASPAPSTSSTGTPTTAPLTVPATDVQVRVLNGTSTAGLAARAAAQLRAQGFDVVGTGDAPARDQTGSTVQYPQGRADSARTLAAAVPGATTQAVTGGGSALTLVVGSSFTGVSALPGATAGSSARASSTATISARTADQDTCVA